MTIEIDENKIVIIKNIEQTIKLEFYNGDKYILTPYINETFIDRYKDDNSSNLNNNKNNK